MNLHTFNYLHCTYSSSSSWHLDTRFMLHLNQSCGVQVSLCRQIHRVVSYQLRIVILLVTSCNDVKRNETMDTHANIQKQNDSYNMFCLLLACTEQVDLCSSPLLMLAKGQTSSFSELLNVTRHANMRSS